MRRAWGIAVVVAAGCSGNGGPATTGCVAFGPVCLFPTLAPAQRTGCGDVVEYCDARGSGAPNLACLGGAGPAPPAAPSTVTLTGFVHAFSAGPDTTGLSVTVLDAAALAGGADPATVTPLAATVVSLDPATQRACDRDAARGCSLPSATGCTLPRCNDGLGGRVDDRKYCRVDGTQTTCADRLRWEARYTLDGVPTNRQLVVRTRAAAADNPNWATVYSWNVYLSTGDPACSGPEATDCLDLGDAARPRYQLNASALARSDYINIPQAAGLSGGIAQGEGAVAGEVHDCDNVRVENVAVGVSPAPDRLTYFNGNPVMTLPDPSRAATGTDRLGLFAALNLLPGKVTVQAAGLTAAGGAMTSFGKFEARVYGDSVSVVNVNGGKPPL
jgi:hypothetical protein